MWLASTQQAWVSAQTCLASHPAIASIPCLRPTVHITSLEHRFFPPPELSTSVLPPKGSFSSSCSSFWSELQCCHGVICLPVHLGFCLHAPLGQGHSSALLSWSQVGPRSWPLCTVEGLVSSNGAGCDAQGLHEGTEGPNKLVKVPRVLPLLISEGSTSFKRCDL